MKSKLSQQPICLSSTMRVMLVLFCGVGLIAFSVFLFSCTSLQEVEQPPASGTIKETIQKPTPSPTIKETRTSEHIIVGERGLTQMRKVPGGKGREFSLTFDGRETKFVFILKGKPALGVWPEFAVLIDGRVVYNITVASPEWKQYSFTRTLDAGAHKIVLKHTNDYYNPEMREDRNLYIKEFRIISTGR